MISPRSPSTFTREPGLRLGSHADLGNGNPLQDSCLENPMDRGAWWATVRRVAKSQTRLSDYTFFHFLYAESGSYQKVGGVLPASPP